MAENPPSVLISSTFYDLGQVRADLVDFIEKQLGYRALAFENSGFPVDPDSSAVENCQRRVAEDTDILVLVIGGRYGSITDEHAKSVTNLEYLAARASKLPIFVFVERTVLSYLRVWENDKTTNFRGIVDTPLLFDFINEIKNTHKTWVHSFERAQDLISNLRSQFALHAARNIRRVRAASVIPDSELQHLRGDAFRIAVEKPRFWEFDLLDRLIQEAIEKREYLSREYRSGSSLGPHEDIELENLGWLSGRLNELVTASSELATLMNKGIAAALGPPGMPGSVKEALYTAHRIGEIYEFAMRWSLRVRGAHMHEIMHDAQKAASRFSAGIIDSVEKMAGEFGGAVRELKRRDAAGESGKIHLNYTFEANATEFSEALARARSAFESGEHLR